MSESRRRKFILIFVAVFCGLLCAPAAITGVMAAVAMPSYMRAVRHAREAVLREDLHTMRTAQHAYTADKKQPAPSLSALVKIGYLETIPTDPMTKSTTSWTIDAADGRIHSGSGATGSDGRPYNQW